MSQRSSCLDFAGGFALVAALLCLAACGKSKAPADAQPAPKVAAQPAPAQPVTDAEPSEETIRQAYLAPLDELNRKGGVQIEMSGARSKPFQVKVDSLRKIGCVPANKDFICEVEVRTSYPGTELPAETAMESIRFRKDAQGQWTNK